MWFADKPKAASIDLWLCDIYNIRMSSTTYTNSLIKQTDKLRGDVPRSTYVRRAIENYLKQSKLRRPLRESRHLEAPVVSAGSHNETPRPVIVI